MMEKLVPYAYVTGTILETIRMNITKTESILFVDQVLFEGEIASAPVYINTNKIGEIDLPVAKVDVEVNVDTPGIPILEKQALTTQIGKLVGALSEPGGELKLTFTSNQLKIQYGDFEGSVPVKIIKADGIATENALEQELRHDIARYLKKKYGIVQEAEDEVKPSRSKRVPSLDKVKSKLSELKQAQSNWYNVRMAMIFLVVAGTLIAFIGLMQRGGLETLEKLKEKITGHEPSLLERIGEKAGELKEKMGETLGNLKEKAIGFDLKIQEWLDKHTPHEMPIQNKIAKALYEINQFAKQHEVAIAGVLFAVTLLIVAYSFRDKIKSLVSRALRRESAIDPITQNLVKLAKKGRTKQELQEAAALMVLYEEGVLPSGLVVYEEEQHVAAVKPFLAKIHDALAMFSQFVKTNAPVFLAGIIILILIAMFGKSSKSEFAQKMAKIALVVASGMIGVVFLGLAGGDIYALIKEGFSFLVSHIGVAIFGGVTAAIIAYVIVRLMKKDVNVQTTKITVTPEVLGEVFAQARSTTK